MLAELEQGVGDMRGSASWSTRKDIAYEFSDRNYKKETTDKKVILVTQEHPKATSIKYLSENAREDEVLAAKWCRYKLVKQYAEGDYIILEVEPSNLRGSLF
jgi:hypothetical protein